VQEQSRDEQKQKMDELQDLKAKSLEERKQKLDEMKDINKGEEE